MFIYFIVVEVFLDGSQVVVLVVLGMVAVCYTVAGDTLIV